MFIYTNCLCVQINSIVPLKCVFTVVLIMALESTLIWFIAVGPPSNAAHSSPQAVKLLNCDVVKQNEWGICY